MFLLLIQQRLQSEVDGLGTGDSVAFARDVTTQMYNALRESMAVGPNMKGNLRVCVQNAREIVSKQINLGGSL